LHLPKPAVKAQEMGLLEQHACWQAGVLSLLTSGSCV